jgi:hypothetical protein
MEAMVNGARASESCFEQTMASKGRPRIQQGTEWMGMAGLHGKGWRGKFGEGLARVGAGGSAVRYEGR